MILTETEVRRNFIVRPPTMEDLQAAYELAIKCETFDMGEPETTLDEVQVAWQNPDFNLQTDLWLVFTPEGKLVGRGVLIDAPPVMMYAGSNIDPDFRGRGIGTYLQKLQEERAQKSITKAPDGARVVLTKGTVSTNLGAKQLYEQNGYNLVRHFYSMEIEMTALPPVPQLPSHIQIRTFEKGLERAVYKADDEAFRDHWGFVPGKFEDWEHQFFNNESFDPTLWFLAMDGNEIAGITLCKNDGLQVGWIDTVATRRPWRKQGLALALLYHAFGEFYKRGRRRVGLGVDAASLTSATRLYEKAGMHVIRQFDRYQKELRPGQDLSTQTLGN